MSDETATLIEESTLRFEWVDPNDIRENEWNWRKHSSTQKKLMKEIYAQVGDAGAAVVNERVEDKGWEPHQVGLVFVDGHLRRDVKIKDKSKMPVLIGQWTPEEEKIILSTHDTISLKADIDGDKFKLVLEEMGDGNSQTLEFKSFLGELEGIAGDNATTPNFGSVLKPGTAVASKVQFQLSVIVDTEGERDNLKTWLIEKGFTPKVEAKRFK